VEDNVADILIVIAVLFEELLHVNEKRWEIPYLGIFTLEKF
jgi:hypothetical protein